MYRPVRPARPAARSRRIALATHRVAPEATDDDCRLIASLSRRCAARIEAVPWDSVNIDWEGYDAVVIRSTWDYHLDPARFAAWAEGLEVMGVAVWNPAAVVRWNADKRYLRDLERAGVPVVPTEWIRRGSDVDLASVLRRRGWLRAVVKPSVAATAYRTWTVDTADPESTRHEAALAAALDRLAPGSLLYARVDGAVSDGSHAPPGTFLLMEAELIEPVLFLGSAEHAADRLATAVARRL